MSIDELVAACAAIGVHVVFLPVGVAGGYVHDIRLIVVDSGLPAVEQRAVLAHEYVHALHGHDGVQDETVESSVDREAAQLLISPVEYAAAERLFGVNVVAIADELGVPMWVVAAYREWLAERGVCGLVHTHEFSPPLDWCCLVD
ncbi:ImmA/IrrE family metallo-endopeptidase [Trueperella bialowiezensis]|uniref:Domain of uncharacterized function (DUF955) n=1 Tax=Trueperella bialowiezensis TaxID=312285 RepID=A0A3S4YXW7_9ACTO|nr:ImmA/IrrE family metallo-endopeptidase [Trueperella bialowiezensis]VEI13254.1 Domain of uncharacterised function (DUF955) [Trueperella bialowiezensis]